MLKRFPFLHTRSVEVGPPGVRPLDHNPGAAPVSQTAAGSVGVIPNM